MNNIWYQYEAMKGREKEDALYLVTEEEVTTKKSKLCTISNNESSKEGKQNHLKMLLTLS